LEQIPITQSGYGYLTKELDKLKSVVRPANIKAIEEARAHGDLSENAEYHAAKERQSFIVGRIDELAYKLACCQIIDPDTLPKDKVLFGSKVLLENVDTEEDAEYQLVGPEESNVEKGLISVSSPLGRAMIGKQPGDEILVDAPGGKRVYELVEIL
jgi:transcription elongation factor GreA